MSILYPVTILGVCFFKFYIFVFYVGSDGEIAD